jgi:hypothetical protein
MRRHGVGGRGEDGAGGEVVHETNAHVQHECSIIRRHWKVPRTKPVTVKEVVKEPPCCLASNICSVWPLTLFCCCCCQMTPFPCCTPLERSHNKGFVPLLLSFLPPDALCGSCSSAHVFALAVPVFPHLMMVLVLMLPVGLLVLLLLRLLYIVFPREFCFL